MEKCIVSAAVAADGRGMSAVVAAGDRIMSAIVSASSRVVSAIVVAAFMACEVHAAVTDQVENGVEEKVEKVDGDVFGGTF
ncbi:MAG: hypothetical protein LBC04_03965, partial [Holosporaceae bacterium]|nr:hypothetical protein [Holosporaceae bacterium]